MKLPAGFWTAAVTAVTTAALCGAVALIWFLPPPGKGAGPADKPAPPAVVPTVLKEEDVNVMTLTPTAEERLGIRLRPVEVKAVPRVRGLGGEVVVPAGRTLLVAAPLAGTLKAPAEGVPAPGRHVKKGDPILVLLPLLTPEARANLATASVEADAQIKNAQTQLKAADVALVRAKQLFSGEAGSKRMVDEAQAAYELALRAVEAAEARRAFLEKVLGEFDKGTGAPVAIAAPADGLLRNVAAGPDQPVPAGGALFEIVDLRRAWVRVPVYAGDHATIDGGRDALVQPLAAKSDADGRAARPVAAPPSATALAATVDLFYELDNADGKLQPGQRVRVTVPLAGAREEPVVPWSAVVHDIHGGTWVYEQVAPHRYARRRVQVRHVTDGLAVLAGGPPAGARVVTEGAAELFGTEVGFTK